jgi:hypothetical protein
LQLLALDATGIEAIAGGANNLSFFPARLFAQVKLLAKAQQALLHRDIAGELSRVSFYKIKITMFMVRRKMKGCEIRRWEIADLKNKSRLSVHRNDRDVQMHASSYITNR